MATTTATEKKGVGIIAFLAIDFFVSLLISFLVGGVFGLIFTGLLVIYIIARLKEFQRTKTLANVIILGLIAVVVVFLAQTQMPMTYKQLPWFKAKTDHSIATLVDPTDVKADITWETYKQKHGAEMLAEYRKRLAAGDVEGAAKVEVEFQEKWDKERWEEKYSSPEASKPEHNAEKFSHSRYTGSYGPGTYTLDLKKGETSGWIQIECNRRYGFRNPDASFTVYYKDGQSLDSWEAGKWLDQPWIKVKNQSNESIILKVY